MADARDDLGGLLDEASAAAPPGSEPLPYASSEADRRPLVCPKCRGSMTIGFLADRAHGGAVRQAKWVEGVPEGTALQFLTGLRTIDRANLRVDTYRCVECGYLKSYATEPAAKN
jgi:hypothetical protein